MATVYHVFDGVIGSKTTLDKVKEYGLKAVCDLNIKNRHAVKYSAGGPDAKMEAVMIYEAEGDNFTGERV